MPDIHETNRERMRDVLTAGLAEILASVRSREFGVTTVHTREASPFARSLLFDYVAAYMYEGDAPLAERRAQALTLDRNLLRDLLGEAELRELLDPAAVEAVELELQCLAANRQARNADQLHDLLRRLGDLDQTELAARVTEPEALGEWLAVLQATRRACPVRIGGEERWIPMEDSGRYRDGLGVAAPQGVPEVFLRPTPDALEGLLTRYSRTHGPFVAQAPAARWSIPESMVRGTLQELDAAGSPSMAIPAAAPSANGDRSPAHADAAVRWRASGGTWSRGRGRVRAGTAALARHRLRVSCCRRLRDVCCNSWAAVPASVLNGSCPAVSRGTSRLCWTSSARWEVAWFGAGAWQ